MWVARAVLAVTVFGTIVEANAQSGFLNDTGETSCYDGSGATVACNSAIAGGSALSHQDGRYGRDVAAATGQLTKVGGGAAGFDFTRLCWNGQAEGAASCGGSLVANFTGTASASPTTDWACTKDNVTGLVWSLQSQTTDWSNATTATFPDAGHNIVARCGYSSGWRLPNVREMLGLVHNGLTDGRKVDGAYFPSTDGNGYWTLEAYAPDPLIAWFIDFNSGNASRTYKNYNFLNVRLVRDGF